MADPNHLTPESGPTQDYDPKAPTPGGEPGEDHSGELIGPYKLLERLGTGGMGEVWLAEQNEPVRRRVALKLIKAGMDTQQVLARFEAERQALALMDHPNIAKVLDAGRTEAGRPYFVMELVKGTPLTAFCDQAKLSIRDRLELFIPICQALQHAHQKGIIHRDLKPSNILVSLSDGQAVPKVIDFGVAKAISQKLTERTLHTAVGMMVGTLEYMAPEQAELNNLDIDTRADIYSLGVVLYELLAGSPPFAAKQLREAAFDEMLRVIREVEPPKPSTKLSGSDELPSIAARRQVEPRRLTRSVQGELDWIVMKCLEKERSRRYESANGLAMDIQRFLTDEPVLAGPPSAAYRLRKFVRRNRVPVVAASVVLLSLTAGVIGTTWGHLQANAARDAEAKQRAEAEKERDVARAQRRRTRNALDAMTSSVSTDWLATQTSLSPQQKAFLQSALQYYKEFAQEAATEREEQVLRAAAYSRLGTIWRALGAPAEAHAALTAAQDILNQLVDERPQELKLRHELAQHHNDMSSVHIDLGKNQEAEAALERARALFSELVNSEPTSVVYRRDLSRSEHNLAQLMAKAGQNAKATTLLHHARDRYQSLADDHPAKPELRAELANTEAVLGKILELQGSFADAINHYTQANKLFEALSTDASAPDCRWDRAACLNHLGTLQYMTGKPGDSEKSFRASVDLSNQVLTAYPLVPKNRAQSAASHINLGNLLTATGKLDESQRTYGQAAQLLEKLIKDNPNSTDYRIDLGACCCNMGHLAKMSGNPADSLSRFSQAIATIEPILVKEPKMVKAQQFLRNSHWGRAEALVLLQRHADALPDWDRSLQLDDGSEQLQLRLGRADSLIRTSDRAKALAEADELGKTRKLRSASRYNLAKIYAVAATQSPSADAERTAGLAMATLQQAIASGYKDIAKIKADKDLEVLHDREDFKKLVAELEGILNKPTNSSKPQ